MEIIDLPYDGAVPVHTAKEGVNIIRRILKGEPAHCKYRGRTPEYYSSAVASFDIETSKVLNMHWKLGDPEKFHYFSFPFCWQFMVNGIFIFGRDPEEFFDMLSWIQSKRRLVIYIHNINFEFGNLIDYFTRDDVEVEIMMKNSTTPLFVRRGAFEFRCSAQLTHKPLAMLGKEIDYPKLQGDFDYSIARDWYTRLSPLEMNYCYRDVAIPCKWIEREAKNYTGKKHPGGLPFTQTGYVREAIKHAFSYTPSGMAILKECELSYDEYLMFARAFYGGYTHANFRQIAKEISKMLHFDITSAYPWAMVTKLFPYKFRRMKNLTIAAFKKGLRNPKKAYVVNVRFTRPRLKKGCIPYIPFTEGSYKHDADGAIAENGRLLYADEYVGTFCDVDMRLILRAYEFESFEIIDGYTSEKRPLPPAVIKVLIKYFCDKTTLKGVRGAEYAYALAKQLLNGIYGLSAQSPEKSNFTVNDDLTVTNKGNTYEPSKVLPYQWAIYITAYVREVIYGNILDLPDWNLYLYADTDSLFTIEDDRVKAQIEKYNEGIKARLEEMREKYPDITPANPKGEIQYLGLLLPEKDDCSGFMTIGAKRYYIKHPDGTVDLTVSGLRATKTWYDKDENDREIRDAEHHHNGFNTDRLIKKFGTIEKAFQAIRNGEECTLPYVEDVDKLSNYVTVYPYEGILCGHKVKRPCSYTLYPVGVSLSLNETLLNVLKMVARGDQRNIVYSEIY